MRTLVKEVEGIDWGDAAVMNCRWKGPRIRDVLLRAGLREEASGPHEETHVAFACYKVRCQEDYWFGSSVTLERCLREDGDAILALEVSLFTFNDSNGWNVECFILTKSDLILMPR